MKVYVVTHETYDCFFGLEVYESLEAAREAKKKLQERYKTDDLGIEEKVVHSSYDSTHFTATSRVSIE